MEVSYTASLLHSLIMPLDSLSEQLVHSLIAQEKLTAERDRALEYAKEAEGRVEVLESHFKKMKKLQSMFFFCSMSDIL